MAIIITIMILELKQPASDGLKDLLALMPTLLAYLLSFVFVAIYWVNHHLILHAAKQINVKILWCNISRIRITETKKIATPQNESLRLLCHRPYLYRYSVSRSGFLSPQSLPIQQRWHWKNLTIKYSKSLDTLEKNLLWQDHT